GAAGHGGHGGGEGGGAATHADDVRLHVPAGLFGGLHGTDAGAGAEARGGHGAGETGQDLAAGEAAVVFIAHGESPAMNGAKSMVVDADDQLALVGAVEQAAEGCEGVVEAVDDFFPELDAALV